MTNVDVKKQALIFANFRLKDSDGSVKRQKRTAMSDFSSPFSRSLSWENKWKCRFHSFFQMRKPLESETKFFFLSSLFVLSWKTKKHFLLSLYAYLNKYRRCCILGKVRPLQIVTTPPSLRLVSSLFQATSKPLLVFAQTNKGVLIWNNLETYLLYPGGEWVACSD